jgi:multidrug efflux system membrane fusion protein
VTPLNTVAVRTQVDGRLLTVRYREGQIVAKGELLAEIDLRPFQAQLEQFEGELGRDEALHRLIKALGGGGDPESESAST